MKMTMQVHHFLTDCGEIVGYSRSILNVNNKDNSQPETFFLDIYMDLQ